MFPSGASVNVWTFFNSCVWVHQLSSVWKDGSQNHTVTAGKGSNMQNMLENWRFCRTWRIFLKNSAQFNCSEQTRYSWTTITTKKITVVDHPGNNTVLRTKGSQTFEWGYFNNFSYFFVVLWTKCKHLLCKISYSGQY